MVSPYKPFTSSKNTFRVSLSRKNTSDNRFASSINSHTGTEPSNLMVLKVPSSISFKVTATALILSSYFSNLAMLTRILAAESIKSSTKKPGIALKISLVKVSPYMLAISSKIILGVSPNVKCVTIS